MCDTPELPEDLLRDLSNLEGSRVTLVIGGGCSHEPPTNLPLSKQISRDAHQRLLDDKILPEACDNPEDLTELADAVHQLRGSQKPLVDRMEMQRFIGVNPNLGHKIAAALMREGIIATVITLNFDDAMTQAVGYIGGGSEIAEIRGPESHHHLGAINLVYLHRKADADPEELILRTTSIEKEWEDNWEEAIVRSQLLRSSCVFVGLGSPATVLTKSIEGIREAVGDESTVYQVDPCEYEWEGEDGNLEQSPFTEELGIPEDRYRSMKWCEFMEAAGERVRLQQLYELCERCVTLASDEEEQLFTAFDAEEEGDLRQRIRRLLDQEGDSYSLLELGQLRSHWLLESDKVYVPHSRDHVPEWLAQLLVSVDYIARRYEFTSVVFHLHDGCVEFRGGTGRTVIAHLAHGRSQESWENLETLLPSHRAARRERTTMPTCVLAEGLRGNPSNPSAPRNIADPDGEAGVQTQHDVTDPDPPMTRVEAYHLHEQNDVLDRVFG